MEIQKRDLEIIKDVNRYGLIKKSTLCRMFNSNGTSLKNSYMAKRLKVLEENKYLKSQGQAYKLGNEGKVFLYKMGIGINYSRIPIGSSGIKIYKDADVMIKLNFMTHLSRIEYLEELKNSELNKVKVFCGKVTDKLGIEFLVYRIDKVISPSLFKNIELDTKKTDIYNVIVAIDNISQLIILKEKLESLNLKKALIILNNENGFKLIRLYFENKLTDNHLYNYLKSVNPNLNIQLENQKIKFNGLPVINQIIIDIVKQRNEKLKYKTLNAKEVIIFSSSEYKEYFDDDCLTKCNIIQSNKFVRMDSFFDFIKNFENMG